MRVIRYMLLKYKNLVWGTSEKDDGSMKFLGHKTNSRITDNRINFFKKRNIDYKNVVSAVSTYSNKVKIVNKKDSGKIIKGYDALITNEKDLFLTITVADCLPIYYYTLKLDIIGLAHAGWQEIKLGIASQTVKKLKEKFNIKPDEIKVYIGPHIKSCHFEVKDDVLKKFKDYPESKLVKAGKKYIDLSAVVKDQLMEMGVAGKNIEISHECTYCLPDKYFSNRREKLKDIQAMIAYIGMK